MVVYHYDPQTGEYLGSAKARKSPLWKPGDPPGDEYLIPACATTEAPPGQKDGHSIVRRNGEWIHEEIKAHKPEPTPEPPEETEESKIEALIQAKVCEMAVTALIAEGKLTADRKIAKEKRT